MKNILKNICSLNSDNNGIYHYYLRYVLTTPYRTSEKVYFYFFFRLELTKNKPNELIGKLHRYGNVFKVGSVHEQNKSLNDRTIRNQCDSYHTI